LAANGDDSMMAKMADPNVVGGISRSLAEQSRLKGMMS
jgi:hypothetical protein